MALVKNSLENKHLSCLSSLTLLGVLEKHDIEIKEYHSHAIVHNFNQILVGMELFEIN